MSLPASGSISLTQVMDELRTVNPGRAYPISLGDSDVRALAGVPSGSISLTDLYGKSSFVFVPITATAHDDTQNFDSGVAGNADLNPSCAASGGNGTLHYSWTFTSNTNGFTIVSGTEGLTVPTVRYHYGRFLIATVSAQLQVTVTDDYEQNVTRTCTVTADISH